MNLGKTKFSLQEFLDLPESGDRSELIDEKIVSKVSPKYKHASVQGRLLLLMDDWCAQEQFGRVCPEWAVVLKRNGIDWVPVPDITYVSYNRLSADWEEDAPCPIPPELVIEIISPGQSFGEMTSKASDYLRAGVDRVWIIDNQGLSISVFGNSELPQTIRIDDTISDSLLPGLEIALTDIFAPRRLPNAE
jgi:Uma2 family endonuclease